MTDWVKKEKYCESSGVPWSTVKGWVARHWTKGVQYNVIGQTTVLNPKEIDKWISERGQQALDQQEMASKYESTIKEKSIRRQLKAMPTARLTLPQQYVNENESLVG